MLLNNLFQIGTLILLLLAIAFVIICLKSGRIGRGILQMLWHLGGFAVVAFVVLTGAVMAAGAMAVAFTFIIKWSLVILVTALISIAIKALLRQGGFAKMKKKIEPSKILPLLKNANGMTLNELRSDIDEWSVPIGLRTNFEYGASGSSHNLDIINEFFQSLTYLVEEGFLTGVLYAGNITLDAWGLRNVKVISVNKDNFTEKVIFDGISRVLIFTDDAVCKIKKIILGRYIRSFDFLVRQEWSESTKFDLVLQNRIVSGFFITQNIMDYIYQKADTDIFSWRTIVAPSPRWLNQVNSVVQKDLSNKKSEKRKLSILDIGTQYIGKGLTYPRIVRKTCSHRIGSFEVAHVKDYLGLYYLDIAPRYASNSYRFVRMYNDNTGLCYPIEIPIGTGKFFQRNNVIWIDDTDADVRFHTFHDGYFSTRAGKPVQPLIAINYAIYKYRNNVDEGDAVKIFNVERLSEKPINIITFIDLLYASGYEELTTYQLYNVACFFYSDDRAGNMMVPSDKIFNTPISKWRRVHLQPITDVIRWWNGYMRLTCLNYRFFNAGIEKNPDEYINKYLVVDRIRDCKTKIDPMSDAVSDVESATENLLLSLRNGGFDIEKLFPLTRDSEHEEIGRLYLTTNQIYTGYIVSYQDSLEELHIYCPRTYMFYRRTINTCKNLKKICFHLIPSDVVINPSLEMEEYVLRVSPEAFYQCPNLRTVEVIDINQPKVVKSYTLEYFLDIGLSGVSHQKSCAGLDYMVLESLKNAKYDADKLFISGNEISCGIDGLFSKVLLEYYDTPIKRRNYVTSADYYQNTDACAGGILKFLVKNHIAYDEKIPITAVADLITNQDYAYDFMEWLLYNEKISEEDMELYNKLYNRRSESDGIKVGNVKVVMSDVTKIDEENDNDE